MPNRLKADVRSANESIPNPPPPPPIGQPPSDTGHTGTSSARMHHDDNARNRRVGIGLVCLTTLCFATLDASAKWLVQSLPVLEVVWLRFTAHVLITSALLTGGLHEDGLADTADGLIGGRDRAHRLEIMKDSRIGSYGALALGLLVLLRCFALTALIAAGAWGAVLAIAALSRAPMAALMAFLPNARGTGLAQSLGRPSRNSAGLAAALALLIALAATGATALPMCLTALLITLAFGAYAKARIGGQTGDILGASQQLSEAAMLTLASALI